jgi:hypothetical protein
MSRTSHSNVQKTCFHPSIFERFGQADFINRIGRFSAYRHRQLWIDCCLLQRGIRSSSQIRAFCLPKLTNGSVRLQSLSLKVKWPGDAWTISFEEIGKEAQ